MAEKIALAMIFITIISISFLLTGLIWDIYLMKDIALTVACFSIGILVCTVLYYKYA